jgi:hypothetical protein
MPDLEQNRLYGFVMGFKKYRNPTLASLIQYEDACRIIDPSFFGGEVEEESV